MNIENIKKAAETAKAKTSDKRWNAAIDKAVAGVQNGWIVTELQHCIVITTESEKTYKANDKHCQCEAFFRGQACKHRALYRLIQLGASAPAADVEAAFAAKFPGYHIADYLLKNYGQNSFRYMNRELVADIHALILAA